MARDWTKARMLHELIYPLSVAIYRQSPGNRANARLKACLKLLGRLDDATARPPIQPLDGVELDRLQTALERANAAV